MLSSAATMVRPSPTRRRSGKFAETWGFAPGECLMIGDYRFDIEAGRRAGTYTVLFTGAGGPTGLAPHERADFTLASFATPETLWGWIEQIDLGPAPEVANIPTLAKPSFCADTRSRGFEPKLQPPSPSCGKQCALARLIRSVC